MKLNRDEAREYIREQIVDYLGRHGINASRPFTCLNPAHPDKHPSMSIAKKEPRAYCPSCKTAYDTFDLIERYEGITDYNEKLEFACKLYGIDLEKGTHPHWHEGKENSAPAPEERPQVDYTQYFRECQARLKDTDYPQRRGLTHELCEKYILGYDPQWQSPTGLETARRDGKADPPKTPRLIIPTSKYTYIARDVRPDTELTESGKKFKKMKEGNVRIMNLKAALAQDKPIIIVEGEIDALSIIQSGGNAIGLGGLEYKELLAAIDERKPKQPFIIALDNDTRGVKAAAGLEAALKQRGVVAKRANLFEGYKDANEMLQRDPEKLKEAVSRVSDPEYEQRIAYFSSRAGAHLQEFLDGIGESVNTMCLKTGFAALDNVLDGGLYEGLYTIGAMTSLGKTTFVMQIADSVAASGHDVIIIALEMARSELMAKSISRHTAQIALDKGIDTSNAKTARGIMDGKRYTDYNHTERELIEAAEAAYGEYADHLFIHEGIGNIGIREIRELVEQHIRYTGNRPLLVIDYMQILPAADPRASDKQNTDTAVLEMKRLSRDKKIPVIAISSFNRTGYNQEANFAQFKESGAIEYGSDVALILQLQGAGTNGFNATEAKRKDPRQIELVVLKNRQGRIGDKTFYDYYPKFNYFIETGRTTE